MCKYNLFSVFLAFITVTEYFCCIKAYRKINENGVETILALENEPVSLECRSDTQIKYCGFIHPNGKRYSFTGNSIYDGKCSKEVNATIHDAGTWRCHIGIRSAGIEIIQLNVVGELAAVTPNITAVHGKSTTLYCTTTKGFIPLSYCRFEPPNAMPFSIDSSVNETSPLLKRYYFPSNKSLDRGDCAITIRKVKYEDHGTWTCGAGFDDGNEYIDFINFKVEGIYTMSKASATGITFGALGLIVLLALLGFFAWKNQRFLGSIRRREETMESHELEHLPSEATSSRRATTPQPGRSIPSVIIESPSEASEQGTASPLVSAQEEL